MIEVSDRSVSLEMADATGLPRKLVSVGEGGVGS